MNRLFLCRQQTTVLRGMAAIIIALFHVFIEWQLPRVVNVMGSICVALFLLLSGFGIHESYKTTGNTFPTCARFLQVLDAVPHSLSGRHQFPGNLSGSLTPGVIR